MLVKHVYLILFIESNTKRDNRIIIITTYICSAGHEAWVYDPSDDPLRGLNIWKAGLINHSWGFYICWWRFHTVGLTEQTGAQVCPYHVLV